MQIIVKNQLRTDKQPSVFATQQARQENITSTCGLQTTLQRSTGRYIY